MMGHQEEITSIAIEACLPLRHKILWPDREMAFSRVEGDETARHYGYYHQGVLVSCLSLFTVDRSTSRLRKFCTDTSFQSRGFGSRLLAYALEKEFVLPIEKVVASARIKALPFYERQGFISFGQPFQKENVPHIFIQIQREAFNFFKMANR